MFASFLNEKERPIFAKNVNWGQLAKDLLTPANLDVYELLAGQHWKIWYEKEEPLCLAFSENRLGEEAYQEAASCLMSDLYLQLMKIFQQVYKTQQEEPSNVH